MQVPAVQEYIKDLLESDQKFLAFAHHTSLLDGMETAFRKCACIYKGAADIATVMSMRRVVIAASMTHQYAAPHKQARGSGFAGARARAAIHLAEPRHSTFLNYLSFAEPVVPSSTPDTPLTLLLSHEPPGRRCSSFGSTAARTHRSAASW